MNRERGRSVFFFRKWYFDAQTADGTFLFAYFAPMTLFGSRSAELVISIYPPGGVELRRSFHLNGDGIRLAPDHSRAEFGSGALSVSKGTATLEFSIDDTSLFLHYTSGAAAWIPTLPGLEPGVLLSMRNRLLTWTVPVPHAKVEGQARVCRETIPIRGLGYHDFVLTDIPPWRLPLRELLWGRALSDNAAVIWNRPCFQIKGKRAAADLGWILRENGDIDLFSHVAASFGAEQDHPATRGRYPLEMDLAMSGESGGTSIAQIRDTRLLLGERVADVQKFRGRPERWLYRRFTNDPVEYKLLSSALLHGHDHPMLAAHEWILWGKR